MPKKDRADQLLVEAGLAETREQAKRLIMAGLISLDQGGLPVPVTKPGHSYPMDSLFIRKGEERFVSRGAYKLLTALNAFSINVGNMVCLDAGASTGGFTDCLLQHGAARVYAVDVGHGQLHERLRNDPRVINLEHTNLRNAPPGLIPEPVDLVTADVSFISLRLVLPPCLAFLKEGGQLIALVKPQFELGPQHTDKGVVKDPALQQRAVEEIITFCHEGLGLASKGVVPASVKGPKGNQEYLVWFAK